MSSSAVYWALLLSCLSLALCQWVDPPPKYPCPNRVLFPCNCTQGSEDGIYLECANTNLASLATGLRQAKTLIHTLTIRSCNIEKLYGDIFRPLSVRVLRLEDTPIKDIADGTFEAGVGVADTLDELHLTNTWLTRMPPSITANLTRLRVLSIDGSRITYLPPNSFSRMTELTELRVANANITSLGGKSVFEGLRKLKRLSLNGNALSDLPKGTFATQGVLDYLDLAGNNFDKLENHFFPELRQLLWLNVSSNHIDRLNAQVFSRNSLLRVLELNSNNLTSLDTNSFRGMRFMRRLHFADNQISKIGRGAFKAVNRIGTIDLARNKLKTVDFQMFGDLRFVESIDLAENEITEIQREAFKNIYLTRVNISHNLLEGLSEGAFRGCENMTVLDLSHNFLKEILKNSLDENSYATELRLEFNNFTSMGQIPMANQTGIKILNVSHNQIVDIPKNSFPKLFELHTIDFSYNHLSDIEKSVFTQLFTLRHLIFHHNNLTNLDTNTFGKLPSLLDLDLSHNQLENVRKGVLSGLTSIRSVELHHNNLKDVPSPAMSLTHMNLAHNNIKEIKGREPWPTMNSLLYLDLSHNQLGDSLTGGRLDNLLTLGTLKLSSNGITVPPIDALRALQSLQILHLDDNGIEDLGRQAFGGLLVVSYLGLSNNAINNITVNAFDGLRQLQTLDLSFNNLSYIPPGAFQGLVALRNIDLSHNSLSNLQNKTHGLFEDCLSIRELNLSHNRIPFVTSKMFPESRWIPYRLERIDLSHNEMPVLTKDILVGTKYLKHLNVSYNFLNDIRRGILNNLTTLEELDISGNQLNDKVLMDEGGLGHLPNLTVLGLADNLFTTLPIDTIVMHQKLKILNVKNNNITIFYSELSDQIKNGLDVYYEGNPLHCNCFLRPVVYWLSSVGRLQGRGRSWDEASCAAPRHLEKRSVGSLIEEQLVCEDSEQASRFRLHPDIKFREVEMHDNGKLSLSWYVNTNEDVGDFRLELRTKGIKPTTLLQEDVDYTTRYKVLNGFPTSKSNDLTLCLLAKTSTGRLRRWRQDQCQAVSEAQNMRNVFWMTAIVTAILAIVR